MTQTIDKVTEELVRYGMLNEDSGAFHGYGVIRVDDSGNLTNDAHEFDLFADTEKQRQISQTINELCSRLYNTDIKESYYLYFIAENELIGFAIKNSLQKGNGRKMVEALEQYAAETGKKNVSRMAVRPELEISVEKAGYIYFRTIDITHEGERITKKCYRKSVLNDREE